MATYGSLGVECRELMWGLMERKWKSLGVG